MLHFRKLLFNKIQKLNLFLDEDGTLKGLEETGNQIKNAIVIGIGPSLFSLLKTNSGGWFNIAENAQTAGTYFIIAFKLGYYIKVESVNYEDEPLQPTIEMKRWW